MKNCKDAEFEEVESLPWSTYQKAVFEDQANGDHHTAIQALAGSGKTKTIVEALNYVPKGKDSFFCAFSKDVATKLESVVPSNATASTLHSHGFAAIRDAYGSQKVNFKRVDNMVAKLLSGRSNVYELKLRICKAVSLSKSALASTVEEIDTVIDTYGIETTDASEVSPEKNREQFISYVMKILEKSREVRGEINFDDMSWIPIVNKLPVNQFDRVFVDEYQDLSPVQYRLAQRSVLKKGRMCVIGDKYQSIYQWRGAESNGMDKFVDKFNARVLPLPICYRCPISVIDLAKTIVPSIEPAPGAIRGLVTEIDEVDMIKGVKNGDFVLSRLNAPLLGLCFSLISDGKRVFIKGRDIGTSLAAFVRKSNCGSIQALMDYTEKWKESETNRLLKREEPRIREAEAVSDKANSIGVLVQNCKSVQDVLLSIDNLFGDASDENSIVLSSVHRAKGLEADNVYVLLRSMRIPMYAWGDKPKDNKMQEELNIAYVAITRARQALHLIVD